MTAIQNEALSSYMSLDRSTMRHLELIDSLSDSSSKNSLLDLIDCTATPMGARLLCQWLKAPLYSVPDIEERQEAIAAFLAHPEKRKRRFIRAI